MKETRVKQHLANAATVLGKGVRVLPGALAMICAVLGVGLVTESVGWSLIAAVPFLIAIDRGMP